MVSTSREALVLSEYKPGDTIAAMMKSCALFVVMVLAIAGCSKKDDSQPPSVAQEKAARDIPAASATNSAAAEAVASSKKDLEEVKADIAKGSYSNACTDLMRRNPQVETVDKALAADIDKTCNVDLPRAYIEAGVKAVEDEAADLAKKPNPHKLKRVNSRCPNAQLTEARQKLEASNNVGDELKARLAKYDELCK
jgi:hypothetical protein